MLITVSYFLRSYWVSRAIEDSLIICETHADVSCCFVLAWDWFLGWYPTCTQKYRKSNCQTQQLWFVNGQRISQKSHQRTLLLCISGRVDATLIVEIPSTVRKIDVCATDVLKQKKSILHTKLLRKYAYIFILLFHFSLLLAK